MGRRMRIVPVIDLRGGRAVAGRAGDRARYAPVRSRIRGGRPEDLSDPLRLARALSGVLGTERFYVADLDRIEGTGENDRVVRDLLADDPARTILWDGGLGRLAAAPAHARLVPILATERLAAATEIDAAAAGAVPAPWLGLDLETRGLRARAPEVTRLGAPALLRRAARRRIGGVVVVHLGRVGTGAGLERARLRRLRAVAPGLAMIAGGGIATLEDLLFLRSIGCEGALLATALHDGRLRPADLDAAGLA
jgi:phosphoribosylformimino-5-aminoimidazole carboxamide ribotide isomerase